MTDLASDKRGPRLPDLEGGIGLGRMPAWLRDAIRGGAEGAVTGVLGGPVDLATMAMRPLGYDVEKPVMGSEWIRDRLQDAGVYGERTGTPAETAGEFIGAIAAPGPDPLQYAGIGLGLGGMIRAYHGSPHSFDKFDMSKIGTGEGAQAYGHGLYFAETPATAKDYQKKLTKLRVSAANRALANSGDDVDTAISKVRGKIDRLKSLPNAGNDVARRDRFIALNEEKLSELNSLKTSGQMSKGALYTVDLDVEPDDLLDWDKPLSQQSEKVRKALEGFNPIFEKAGYQGGLAGMAKRPARDVYERLAIAAGGPSGGLDYGGASDMLHKAGIPGIRYLDGGSRAAGEGSSNFVLFDDAKAKIVERK